MNKKIRIYGDNIVECTRFLLLLAEALNGKIEIENHPKVTTEFAIKSDQLNVEVKIFPGFGRWSNDIFAILEKNGSPLREAPDILVTEVFGDIELLLFSVEFCSALPAGNQAWQRHGRGYSILRSGVPYLFITHLGGFELTSKRVNKSVRRPNILIPYSYLSFSEENDFKFIPIYIPNPGYKLSDSSFSPDLFSSNEDILHLLRELITNEIFPSEIARKIVSRCYHISEEKIENLESLIFEKFSTHKSSHFLKPESGKKWKKIISIPHTKTIKKMNTACSNYSSELISNRLPFCVIPPTKIKQFIKEVEIIYKINNLDNNFKSDLPLVVCFIAGFKPKGDDSRPDRGLPPLVRMLFGEEVNLLSIVYGPMSSNMLQKLKKDSDKTIRSNGLLSSIFYTSDSVIIDTPNIKSPEIFTTKRNRNKKITNKVKWPLTEEAPTKLTEHDVDSALHFLFLHRNNWFEGLCNPPGGDWAGISMVDSNANIHRWLSLPRVSGTSKRPDHIYQFNFKNESFIMIIESKDFYSNLEKNIGPRLIQYLQELSRYPSNIIKQNKEGNEWETNKTKFPLKNYTLITCVAFLEKSHNTAISHKADIEICIKYEGVSPIFKITGKTPVGKKISEIIKTYN